MTTTGTHPGTLHGPTLPGRPRMLSHLAYVTHDAARTVDFYERILGMPLCSSVVGDQVPSTGDQFPYFHFFFRLGDGSTLAFFEAPGLPPANPRGHAAYGIFEHLAFEVDSTEDVDRWHEWLVSNGIDVVGPTDHKIIYSIYFQDPVNDIRLEITTPTVEDWNDQISRAKRHLAGWLDTKKAAAAQNQDVTEALIKYIHAERSEFRGDTPA